MAASPAAGCYRERQERGENHGLFAGDELAGVVSLSTEVPGRWPDLQPGEGFRWLSTMAVSRRPGARGTGAQLLAGAEAWVASLGVAAMYLDCVEGNGYLASFYSGAGYELLRTREMRPWLTMRVFRKGL